MRKTALLVVAGALAMIPAGSAGSVALDKEPEGCVAMNPVQPKCEYTAAEPVDTFGGAAGRGDWVVKVTVGKGKKKTTKTYKSPGDGSPNGIQFMIPKGAKVTAAATSAGSGVIVGGE